MAHASSAKVSAGEKAASNESETVWVVVVVESGIPVLVEAHRNIKTAKRRERLFRRSMREDYDEVGVAKPDRCLH